MLSDKPGSYDFTPARVISGRGDFHFGERADSPLRTIGGEAVKDRIPEQGGERRYRMYPVTVSGASPTSAVTSVVSPRAFS